ncbi:MAG: efflux RND transporter periplasmic adaptor subunit [Candidatus Sericytochromatia bacterium]
MVINKIDKQSKKPIIIFGLIGAILISGTIYGIYYYTKNKKNNIKTITVTRQTLKDIIDVSGTVEAEQDINIRSTSNGLVINRFVQENKKILVGTPLLEIDPQSSKLQLNQAKINASNAKLQAETELSSAKRSLEDAKYRQNLNLRNFSNQINKSKSNIAFLEKELKRNLNLYNQGAIPKQNIDNQKQQIEQSKIDLKTIIDNYNKAKNEKGEIVNAENRINVAQTALGNAIKQGNANILLAQDSIQKTIITAPFNGTITKWTINKGDYLTLGANIARFQNLDQIRLKLPLNELDVPKVNLKSPISIVFDAYPDKNYKGKITWISESSSLENNVQVFPIKVQFDNKSKLIKPGMSGDAQITISEKKDVLSIPLNAIQKKDNKIFVKVFVNNEVVEKEIVAGISTLDSLEIKSGLSQGDKIVVEEEKKK